MIQLASGISVIGFDQTCKPKKLKSAKSLAYRFQNILTCSEYLPRLTPFSAKKKVTTLKTYKKNRQLLLYMLQEIMSTMPKKVLRDTQKYRKMSVHIVR